MDLPVGAPGFWIALVLLGLGAWSLVGFAFQWRVYRGASKRRPRDISDQVTPPSERVAPLVRELEVAGFSRLGETVVEIEGTPISGVSWVLVDETRTIQVEIVEVGGEPFVGLSSYFGDRAVVTTSFPQGERIDQPDFRWVRVRDGVSAAVERHRAEVEDFGRRHGRPVQIDSMADYLRWDAIDRELSSTRRLRGPFLRAQVLPVVAYGLLAACLLWGFFR